MMRWSTRCAARCEEQEGVNTEVKGWVGSGAPPVCSHRLFTPLCSQYVPEAKRAAPHEHVRIWDQAGSPPSPLFTPPPFCSHLPFRIRDQAGSPQRGKEPRRLMDYRHPPLPAHSYSAAEQPAPPPFNAKPMGVTRSHSHPWHDPKRAVYEMLPAHRDAKV